MNVHSSHIPATLNPTAALDQLSDEIAELSAHLEAATARLLDLIREFDARGGWGNGFRSCAEWLGWRVGLDIGAARERVRVARALGTLPLLAQALARGELSYAKVRALTRIATPETEERLLKVGRAGTAAHVERIVRGWRWVDRQAEARETARQHASRALHYGSIAKGQDTASSDIDLMVVSDRLSYADVFGALEEASARLGRKVAPTIYSSQELSRRVKRNNAFVTRVLAQPKLWLIGDESVLAA